MKTLKESLRGIDWFLLGSISAVLIVLALLIAHLGIETTLLLVVLVCLIYVWKRLEEVEGQLNQPELYGSRLYTLLYDLGENHGARIFAREAESEYPSIHGHAYGQDDQWGEVKPKKGKKK